MSVEFTWGSQTFTVNNPEFGNKDSLEFTRIARTSRGNDDIIVRDPDWPEIEKFSLTFVILKEQEADRFRQMLRETLGAYVQYTHIDSETYDAIILNPDTAISQTGRSFWSVSLDLEVT